MQNIKARNSMKFNPLFITAGILVIFLTACSFNIPSPGSKRVDFRTGTSGLELSLDGPEEIYGFAGEAPPPETYVLDIYNAGATPITQDGIFLRIDLSSDLSGADGKLIVKGLQDLTEGTGLEKLEGKTQDSKKGQTVSHVFSVGIPTLNQEALNTEIDIYACYTYSTVLSSSICINTERHRPGEGCRKDEYSYSSQGAPIVISNIKLMEEKGDSDTSVKHRFILTLENSGDEKFSMPDNLEGLCLRDEDTYRLQISEAKVGDISLECGNTAKISDSEAIVVCVPSSAFEEDPLGYFDTTILIKLEYSYFTHLEHELAIITETYSELH